MTTADSSAADPRSRGLSLRVAMLLLLIAAGLRVGFAVARGSEAQLTYPDEEGYWHAARSLARGDGLVDGQGFRATRMPAYPAFLSLFVDRPGGITAARIAQAVLGAAAALAVGWLGTRRFGPTVGIVAGLAVAIDPFLVFFSNLLLTETLFTAALCITWCAVWPMVDSVGRVSPAGSHSLQPPASSLRRVRRVKPALLWRWMAGGVLFALCVYLRPSSLGLVPVFLLLVILRHRDRRAWVAAATMIGVVVILLLPWAWRNHRVTGEWVWGTNRLGISLWDGLGPDADGSSNLAGTADMPEVRGLSEGDWNRYFRDRAIQSARQNPGRVVRLAGVKILRMWNPFPNTETGQTAVLRLISAGWTLPVYVFALAGVWTLRRSGWTVAMLILPAGYFTLLHSIFVGSVRYRLPAMPMLELLAAAGLVAWVNHLRSARRLEPDQPTDSPVSD